MDYYQIGKKILSKLIESGYESFFVGGFVRDRLLARQYHDIDIATSATPSEIEGLFDNIKKKGIKYNSVAIIEEGYIFEITTFRKETGYTDYRHPKVEYTNSINDDLTRRDFTINAMAMDLAEKIIDPYLGINDLRLGLIRTVGNPIVRFKEDALRMLRAFYFVGKLGFDIEEKNFEAIDENAILIKEISSIRVQDELKKLIESPFMVKALKLLDKSLISNYLPGLKKGISYFAMQEIEIHDYQLFLAVCFYLNDLTIPDEFVLSNEIKNKLKAIINVSFATENSDFNRLILYSNGLSVCRYANMVNLILGKNENMLDYIDQEYAKLPIKKTCDLMFKGQDIMALTNRQQASWIGDIVDKIKYEVLMNGLPNEYNKIKEYVINNKLLE